MKTATIQKTLIVILFTALFAMAFTACTKPAVDQPSALASFNTESKIEFKIDGQLKKYTQTSAATTASPNNAYTFLGVKDGANMFSITIIAPDMKPGTYNTASAMVVYLQEGNKTATNVHANNFSVTIISNVDGLINGYFSGSLFDHSTERDAIVMEGLINNVQIKR